MEEGGKGRAGKGVGGEGTDKDREGIRGMEVGSDGCEDKRGRDGG